MKNKKLLNYICTFCGNKCNKYYPINLKDKLCPSCFSKQKDL